MTEFFAEHVALTNYVLLPLAIILARICDVSIGTLRIIFVSRGMKLIAPVLGFFEILIWLVAIGQIMQNLSNWWNYFAYATGFALGNLIGMIIEERLAMGKLAVRVITQKDATALIKALQDRHIGTTSIDAKGMSGKVALIFTIVERKHIQLIYDLVREHNPMAFVSVNDVRTVHDGYFEHKGLPGSIFRRLFGASLKRK